MSDEKSDEPRDPLVGMVLADRYEVVRRLGGGGMGTVYEGRHRALGKRVAIKVLRSEHATKAETLQRFINEARAAAALGHRNIIDASDVGATPTGAMFIVLEYLEGEDLEHRLDREGRLPVARTVALLRQVCSALAAAHAKGIVHRDLKPENVFLVQQGDERDVVKVLDFGISKFTDGDTAAMTRKGAVLGTPSYMAPEQLLDSSKADARVDIYAAGVMAYRMLGGQLPFEGETFYDLAHRVLQEEAPDLETLRPGLPEGLRAAIARAMAKKREARFATMDELSAALAPFAHFTADAATLGAQLGQASTMSAQAAGVTGSTGVTGVRGALGSAGATGATGATGDFAPERSAALDQTGVLRGPRAPRHCDHCFQEVRGDLTCEHCGAELEDRRLGRELAGRYRIDRALAAGGMGRVYVGTHLTLQEPIAIKFLLGQWTESNEARARFRREAMTLAKLRHPGIVTVFDYGELEGELYMVMELVQGRVLRDVVPEGTALPEKRAIALLELVLQVLEFAHAQGVVHRDFKPDNVMLLDLGEQIDRIKLLDFGLAVGTRVATDERLTTAGAIQGTPLYMSPEQCRGRDVGPPTDVYAAGAVLFELLTGAPPFKGASLADTLAQQMFVAPPAMSEHGTRPRVSPALEALVREALAKEPEARPTAAAFRAGLQAVLRGDDPHARRAREAAAKAAAAELGRAERGVYRTPEAPAPATPAGPPAPVVLWNVAPARASALTTMLAMQGAQAVAWGQPTPPPASYEGQPLRALVLPWGAHGPSALAALRARPEHAKLPVLALDATDAGDTMAIIRAGATDVAFGNASDDALGKQLQKLLRRSAR